MRMHYIFRGSCSEGPATDYTYDSDIIAYTILQSGLPSYPSAPKVEYANDSPIIVYDVSNDCSLHPDAVKSS